MKSLLCKNNYVNNKLSVKNFTISLLFTTHTHTHTNAKLYHSFQLNTSREQNFLLRSFQQRNVECRDRRGEVSATFALTFHLESCKIHSCFKCCCQWRTKFQPLNLLAQALTDYKIFIVFNQEKERSNVVEVNKLTHDLIMQMCLVSVGNVLTRGKALSRNENSVTRQFLLQAKATCRNTPTLTFNDFCLTPVMLCAVVALSQRTLERKWQ